jgi:UDP-N-acetylmuramoylalanine--D-glutamate ligase
MKTRTNTKVDFKDELIQSRSNSVREFGGIAHRLEFVDVVNGVEYINDSKATDVNSTWCSLEFMEKPVVWIVGSSEVDTDYGVFADMAKEKVKAIVCLGKNKEVVFDSLVKCVDMFAEAISIDEAVEIAGSFAKDGEVVLFSPACSSYDLFQNYKDRGQQFRKLVDGLK